MENNNNQIKKNNKVLFIIIALVAIAVIGFAIWGISAYLTDTQSKTNTFTIGNVKIRLNEPSWQNTARELTANEIIEKDPSVSNIGSNPAFVYLKVRTPIAVIRKNWATKTELFEQIKDDPSKVEWAELSSTRDEEEGYVETVYYYTPNDGVLNAGETTETLFDKVKLANITDGANLENQSFDIVVTAYAIQSNNLDMPASANTTKLKAQYAWEKYWAQDEDVNSATVTFYDDEGQVLTTSRVRKGTSATLPSNPTKQDDLGYTYEFDGWYTSNNGVEEVADLSNVSEDEEIYAKFTGTEKYTAKIGNKSVSQILKEEGYAGLYGTEVTYQGKNFRVFYVEDSSNKFGEGEGTIYLKADEITNIAVGTYSYGMYIANSYDTSKTVIRKVNPDWDRTRGNIESSWQVNEQAAAYLCDPTIEIWSNYIDQSAEEVNWIIGAPSVEMYMKSYSQYKGNNYNAAYIGSGYQISLDGSNYEYFAPSRIDGAIANDNIMYKRKPQSWWLASPSAYGSGNYMCYIFGNYGTPSKWGEVQNTNGICPLVSLKPGVQLELVSE